MTASITGRSTIRLELRPAIVFSAGTAKGEIVIAMPLTSTMLNRFAPMTLPSESAPWPLARLVMAVISSGRLVPRATIVSPITLSGTPSAAAIFVPLSTRKRAPIAMAAAPTTRASRSFQSGCSPLSSAASSSASSGCFFICMTERII